MKYAMAAIFNIGPFFTFCFGKEKLELKDQKDKESYSLGYQFGQSLKVQGLDVKLKLYNSGIRDGLHGTEPRLTQEEIGRAIFGIQKRVVTDHQKELKRKSQ
jgi:hypothetical protein